VCADALPPLVRFRLLELPDDELALVVACLPADDELAVSLTCRALRKAAQNARGIEGRAGRCTTSLTSLFSSLPKLQWGVSCGAVLRPRLCAIASSRGCLAQLAWLRSVGCPWDAETCYHAADEGHLSVL
jgi:hypothetical protein